MSRDVGDGLSGGKIICLRRVDFGYLDIQLDQLHHEVKDSLGAGINVKTLYIHFR